MNKPFSRLLEISARTPRIILGLMSGTSLDGLDLALCECSEDALNVLKFKTVDYPEELRNRLRAVQSKKTAEMAEICRAHTYLADIHAEYVRQTLDRWGLSSEDIDLLASHGQTIYHCPANDFNSTLQITDGDHLAVKTGLITISDFRQKHTAAGGEGAPLVAFMDEKLFRHDREKRVLLNLGGIGNFTYLPSKNSSDAIITSDTGPANTLINEVTQKYFGQPFDEDGKIARKGKVDEELLDILVKEPFFEKAFPKTTGQEDFSLPLVEGIIQKLNLEIKPEDLTATLTHLTVDSIASALNTAIGMEAYTLYASGGGVHNPVIMEGLGRLLPNAEIHPFEELGMPADAKEAALMAFLADELFRGNKFVINGKEVSLGKISLPN